MKWGKFNYDEESQLWNQSWRYTTNHVDVFLQSSFVSHQSQAFTFNNLTFRFDLHVRFDLLSVVVILLNLLTFHQLRVKKNLNFPHWPLLLNFSTLKLSQEIIETWRRNNKSYVKKSCGKRRKKNNFEKSAKKFAQISQTSTKKYNQQTRTDLDPTHMCSISNELVHFQTINIRVVGVSVMPFWQPNGINLVSSSR